MLRSLKQILGGIAGTCATCLISTAAAAETASSWQAGNDLVIPREELSIHLLEKSSSLGRGIEIRYDLSPRWRLRMDRLELADNLTEYSNSAVYLLDLELHTNMVLLDWHPFTGSFRTSLGLAYNRHRLSALGFSPESIDLGGYELKARELLGATGQVDYASLASYVGVGWGDSGETPRGLSYTLDAGVMLYGKPKVTLDLNGPLGDELKKYYPAEYRQLVSQEQDQVTHKIGKYRYFPVVSVGLRYRF